MIKKEKYHLSCRIIEAKKAWFVCDENGKEEIGPIYDRNLANLYRASMQQSRLGFRAWRVFLTKKEFRPTEIK